MSLSITRAKKALSDTMSMSGLIVEGNNRKVSQLLSLHGHLGLALKEIETLKKQVDTPAARWREKGEPDPHGDEYTGMRSELCMGHLTDDEMANALFLGPSIENLTAAKERIRWLSRSVHTLTLKINANKPTTIDDDVDAVQGPCDAYEQGYGRGYNLSNKLTNPYLEKTAEHTAWHYGCTRGQSKRKEIIEEAG